jgi:hypothetical protein
MEIKGKTEKLLVKQLKPAKGICKTRQLHQKTKPENHGH